MRVAAFLLLILATLAPVRAATAEPDFLGTWIIAESQPAPWIKSPAELFEQERAALVGQRIVFARTRIAAPPPMRCRGPRYAVRHYASDMLFQGVLTRPADQAAALGFAAGPVTTLETGCEGLIDYHFLDRGRAMFALNNAIYLIRKLR